MDNIIGPPVTGENFFTGRDKDVETIIKMLSDGNSILLSGLRRIGKSSIMLSVKKKLPTNWQVNYYDVQTHSYPSDLFSVLLNSIGTSGINNIILQSKTIPKRLISFLKENLRKLGSEEVNMELKDEIINYWKPLTAAIETIISKSESPFILILDEFPIFIERMLKNGIKPTDVQEILSQFKRWRTEYPNFRMIIGGSISIKHVLDKYNIHDSTITDLYDYKLDPLNYEEAEDLIKELILNNGVHWFKEEHISETLNLITDYYPFFLQAFFMEATKVQITKDKLPHVFETKFIPSISRSFFDQFLTRLEKHYKEDERKITEKLFDLMVKKPDYIITSDEMKTFFEQNKQNFPDVDINRLIRNLTGDDFLIRKSNEYTFATRLVADWWKLTRI